MTEAMKESLEKTVNKISELMREREWSVVQLSEHTEIATTTIYQWLRKRKIPTFESICKICIACNISHYEFFAATQPEIVEAKTIELHDIVKNFEPKDLDAIITIAKAITRKEKE